MLAARPASVGVMLLRRVEESSSKEAFRYVEDDRWVSLSWSQTKDKVFQLAVNKDGVIRGNYYNAIADTTEPVYGSVDKKTQRAAWTVGERKTPVYEAGIANLTKDETTMLVHFAKDNSQQFTLVRIQQPEGEQPPEGK